MTIPIDTDWLVGPARPRLRHDEIHLWRGSVSGTDPNHLIATLSDDERRRAGRYRLPVDRARFVTGRGLLRTTLARYVGRPARDLRFGAGPYGKPVLDGEDVDQPGFSLAHSGDLMIIGIAQGREIGVDVERVRGEGDEDDVASMAFSARERATLASLPGAERSLAFFNGWVRKEACAKVLGQGLRSALAEIEVVRGDLATPAIVTLPNPSRTRVVVQSLLPAAGYVAAIAYEAEREPFPSCRLWAADITPPPED